MTAADFLRSPSSLLVCSAFLAACQYAPTAPELQPQLLIGGSPLSPITLDKSGTLPVLLVSVTVNTGGAEVDARDRFLLRGSGELQRPVGGTIAAVDPKVDPVRDPMDTELRGGLDVGVIIDIDIPAPDWERIKDLDEVLVTFRAELVLVSASGAEEVLDAVRLAGAIDPKNDP